MILMMYRNPDAGRRLQPTILGRIMVLLEEGHKLAVVQSPDNPAAVREILIGTALVAIRGSGKPRPALAMGLALRFADTANGQ